MNKELNVRILSHPAITESGVYDAVFAVNGEVVAVNGEVVAVNGEVVEREFEVGVIATYDYEGDTNCYNLRDATVTAICCNEDDEDIADIMECKLQEAIENYMWGE